MEIDYKKIADKLLKAFIYISVYLLISVLLDLIPYLSIFPFPFFPFRRTISIILTFVIFEYMKLGE